MGKRTDLVEDVGHPEEFEARAQPGAVAGTNHRQEPSVMSQLRERERWRAVREWTTTRRRRRKRRDTLSARAWVRTTGGASSFFAQRDTESEGSAVGATFSSSSSNKRNTVRSFDLVEARYAEQNSTPLLTLARRGMKVLPLRIAYVHTVHTYGPCCRGSSFLAQALSRSP